MNNLSMNVCIKALLHHHIICNIVAKVAKNSRRNK